MHMTNEHLAALLDEIACSISPGGMTTEDAEAEAWLAIKKARETAAQLRAAYKAADGGAGLSRLVGRTVAASDDVEIRPGLDSIRLVTDDGAVTYLVGYAGGLEVWGQAKVDAERQSWDRL